LGAAVDVALKRNGGKAMTEAFEKAKADLARIETYLETGKADIAAMQAGEQRTAPPEPSVLDKALVDQLTPDEREWWEFDQTSLRRLERNTNEREG
jgi:hypothetical protein